MQQHTLLMRLLMLQQSILLLLHLLWLRLQMSGQPLVVRTFSDRPFRLQKCSLRLVQPVLYTDLLQLVH